MSPFKLLRVLAEAGIPFDYRARGIVARFLDEEFAWDDDRREWLRKAVYTAKSRGVRNPGGYITHLAQERIHNLLRASELPLYQVAVRRGFGSEGRWDVQRQPSRQR